MCRRGEMPAARRRHDVPELYGDARGETFHARPVAFALVHLWARLAQMSPRFVNLVNRAPVISDLAKRLLGVSPQRKLPKFAVENFKSWFVRRQKTLTAQRPMSDSQPKRVVLWPDT